MDGLRLVFDPALDGGGWPGVLGGRTAMAGAAWTGPLGLLARLELELGLGGRHPPALARTAELARALDGVDGWWRASYQADPLATCARLLHDRDLLALWGWRGEPASERLASLWRATAAALPGVPERLAAVCAALGERRPDLEAVELATPLALLPPGWRALFARLAAAGVTVTTCPLPPPMVATGDLAAARAPDFAPAGDGSLLLLRAPGPLAAADEVAAWLASLPSLDGVLVVGADDVLDGALERHGLPRTGAPTAPPASTALVRLTLAAAFEPADPVDLHALLCADPGPIPRIVGARLIKALRELPGRRAAPWREQLADGLARCDEAWRADTEQRVATLLAPAAHRDEPVAAAELVRRLRTVGGWAHGRLHAVPDLLALVHLVEEACALLAGDRTWRLGELERLCDELDARGGRAVRAQAGLAAVGEPGAVLGPAATIVWWGFTRDRAPSPGRLRLSRAEREALVSLGVTPPDLGQAMVAEAMRWRRPLVHASHRLLLVCPRTDDTGEPAFAHPLWDELRAALRPRTDPSRLECTRLSGGRTTVAARPLPRPATSVQVPVPLALRAVESPSSLEKLLGCSLAWALHYHGDLRDGLARGPGTPSPLLYGTLAHHVLAEVLRDGVAGPAAAAARARDVTTTLLAELSEGLALPRYRAELAALQHAIVASAEELGRLLERTGARVRGVEVEGRGACGDVVVGGKADLLLADPDVVLDLKWGLTSYRDRLDSDTALQLAAYAAMQATAHQVAYFSLTSQELLAPIDCSLPGARHLGKATASATWAATALALARRRAELATGSLAAPAADGTEIEPGLGADGLTLAPACNYCGHGVLCGQSPCR